MVLVPRPCLTCRHGVVIPAIVTTSKVSVLHCRQRQPDVPGRIDCPRYERETGVDERSPRPMRAGGSERPGTASRLRLPDERDATKRLDTPDARR